MNIHDFNPSEQEQMELVAANMKTAKSFNILEFTSECTKRGKMTEFQAQRLRMSVHTFVGAFGVKPLSELLIPDWFSRHCLQCDQKDCFVFKTISPEKVEK